jgi:chitodextrinase
MRSGGETMNELRAGERGVRRVLVLACIAMCARFAAARDDLPPSVPADVRVLRVTSAAAALAWTASTDDGRVAGYRVFRNGVLVGAPAHPRFVDRRLSPGRTYSYAVAAIDAAGNASATSTAIRVHAPSPWPPRTTYPLRLSANRRYLVDQEGVPFLMMGDSPQALIANVSEADADMYFADRQASGFDAAWVNLLCGPYTGGRPDDSTYDGILPFTTPGDLSTPNPAYFARVDAMLRIAAQHGIVVVLDPAETGSFLSLLLSNGVDASRNYGRYLGNRYRSFDNIVWMSGNDFQSWQNPGDDAVVEAVALGIRDVDHRHIHTVELDYPVSGSLDDPTWAPIIDLNASYTYYPTYAQVLVDYDRPDAPPTFMVEANYEFEHNAADLGTPEILRRQEYWTMLSGAAGQLYGNGYIWPFVAGWQNHLDTPGSAQIAHVNALFGPRPWFNLIPDQGHAVVVAGYGTYADIGSLGANDYLTAARTPDGALVLAYMPTIRTITVDMSSLGAPADASWYDPSRGTYSSIGASLPNTGTRTFTPPGSNGDGDGDWVLVLEAPVPPDTLPPSVPAGLAASNVTDVQATLTWSASSDNVAVAAYLLYRDGALVETTRSTSVTDTGLSPSTTYSYEVAALDYANNLSARSAAIAVTTAAPRPSFVQEGYAVPQSPQIHVQATYAAAQTAGNTNILAIGWNDVTSNIVSVVDVSGNVYHPAIATFRGNGLSQAIYYASNIATAAAGDNVVTVTFSQPAAYVDLRVTEYARIQGANPFDGGTSASGSGGNASTSSVSAPAASELLFAAGMTGAVFTGPGAGFTSRVITSPDGDIVEDEIATSAGSYSSSAPLSGGTWLLQLAAFRAQ